MVNFFIVYCGLKYETIARIPKIPSIMLQTIHKTLTALIPENCELSETKTATIRGRYKYFSVRKDDQLELFEIVNAVSLSSSKISNSSWTDFIFCSPLNLTSTFSAPNLSLHFTYKYLGLLTPQNNATRLIKIGTKQRLINTGHDPDVPSNCGKPKMFVAKIPLTITNSIIVPVIPLKFFGDISLMYTGTMPRNNPLMRPDKKRAIINVS